MAEEKNAQEEYELFIKDSAGKRQADTKVVADKEESKANLEADLEEYKAAMISVYKELEATAQYISSLHAQCDFLLNFFEVRKKARAGEIGALQDAKAVLSGADLSWEAPPLRLLLPLVLLYRRYHPPLVAVLVNEVGNVFAEN